MWDVVWTALSSIVVLVVVLFLAYISSKYIAGVGMGRVMSKNIKLLEQIPLGREKALCIVKVGESYLLLGTTSGNITLIKEINKDELPGIEEALGQKEDFDFKQVLDKILKRSSEE